jgi:aminoglycoside phosphotransferase (APT) family kinase protein
MPELDPKTAVAAAEISQVFVPGHEPAAFDPLGSGHIHATLRVRYADGHDDIVLQQLNEHVFPDVEAVTHNVLKVTDHLRAQAPDADPRRVLRALRSAKGDALVRDAEGVPWRGYLYVSDTLSYDVVPTHALAERAAYAFADFVRLLGSMDVSSLAVPLPGFHDLGGRLGQLEAAVSADRAGRLSAVARELEAVREVGAAIAEALASAGAGQLPQHAVHNDCKVNNLLFDAATNEPICVVDLDTVMPGPLLVDFGELVRTATCSAAEDERDLALVDFDEERFAALARGYVAGLGGADALEPFATPAELETLWLGGPWMAVENAARFLADHLDGDLYFPARRADHNLIRTRAQLHLAEQFWEARDRLRSGVETAL